MKKFILEVLLCLNITFAVSACGAVEQDSEVEVNTESTEKKTVINTENRNKSRIDNDEADEKVVSRYGNFEILDEIKNSTKDDLVMQIEDEYFYIGMNYGECKEKLERLGDKVSVVYDENNNEITRLRGHGNLSHTYSKNGKLVAEVFFINPYEEESAIEDCVVCAFKVNQGEDYDRTAFATGLSEKNMLGKSFDEVVEYMQKNFSDYTAFGYEKESGAIKVNFDRKYNESFGMPYDTTLVIQYSFTFTHDREKCTNFFATLGINDSIETGKKIDLDLPEPKVEDSGDSEYVDETTQEDIVDSEYVDQTTQEDSSDIKYSNVTIRYMDPENQPDLDEIYFALEAVGVPYDAIGEAEIGNKYYQEGVDADLYSVDYIGENGATAYCTVIAGAKEIVSTYMYTEE